MDHEAKRATSDDGSAKGELTISNRRSSVPEGGELLLNDSCTSRGSRYEAAYELGLKQPDERRTF